MSLVDRIKASERSANQTIPAELVASIETADIFFRPGLGPEGEDRVMVRCVGLGSFYFEGINPTADRVQRHYDLTRAGCLRAARLLSAHIGQRNRRQMRGRGRRQYGSAYVNMYRQEP